jgi:hypothetical protein
MYYIDVIRFWKIRSQTFRQNAFNKQMLGEHLDQGLVSLKMKGLYYPYFAGKAKWHAESRYVPLPPDANTTFTDNKLEIDLISIYLDIDICEKISKLYTKIHSCNTFQVTDTSEGIYYVSYCIRQVTVDSTWVFINMQSALCVFWDHVLIYADPKI